MNTRHQYDNGIIGNCAYIAHVDTTANVNWMCWPQFDSDFVFGAMLDENAGGEFYIRPDESEYQTRQFYLRNTNILCTEFTSRSGSFRVVDFAPRFFQFDRVFRPVMLMRKIELLNGAPRIKIKCEPTKDYGDQKLECRVGSSHLTFEGREEPVRLYTDISLSHVQNSRPFTLNKNHYFILSWNTKIEEAIPAITESYFGKTLDYWLNWVKNNSIGNFHQKEVIRSALTLKIHQFEDTGAIIASSTTSLPEFPGSGRNWDYRYCWIRDSHYTLEALSSLGSFSELEKFEEFITSLYSPDKGYQPLYSISGESTLTEKQLNLTGYKGNGPVRIGNLAYEQFQYDAYGQLLVSLLPLYVDARFPKRYAKDISLVQIRELIQKILDKMDEPDSGLWEYRNRKQHHTYTYLFHWAGGKSAEKIGTYYKDLELIELARRAQAEASEWIEKCFDADRGVYTEAVETSNLDASLLQLITMQYLDPTSDKAKVHLQVLEKELRSKEGLFYRYKHMDDFGEPETTFLVCSFWYVEALVCVGRTKDAIETFEKLLKLSNHLGLLPEDISSKDGSQWGNFPQTYSHVGLLNAAFRISNKLNLPLFH